MRMRDGPIDETSSTMFEGNLAPPPSVVGIRQRFSADLGSLKCCEAREVRVKLREVAVKLP